MSRITYNAELLKIMALFEKVTRAKLKDCFYDDNNLLTFVVNDYEIGKAIGKHAVNVKRLEQLLKKKVRILGFNPSLKEFARNLIYPISADINFNEGVLEFKGQDTKSKAFLIGRNKVNIKNNLNILRKYFKEVNDIKVI